MREWFLLKQLNESYRSLNLKYSRFVTALLLIDGRILNDAAAATENWASTTDKSVSATKKTEKNDTNVTAKTDSIKNLGPYWCFLSALC